MLLADSYSWNYPTRLLKCRANELFIIRNKMSQSMHRREDGPAAREIEYAYKKLNLRHTDPLGTIEAYQIDFGLPRGIEVVNL
jgi:hypothetical protein